MKNLIILVSLFIMSALETFAQSTEWMDVTDKYITNPNFNGNSNQGWTISGTSWSKACNYNEQEFWNGTWEIYQTLNIPNGHYRLSVNAMHRPGGNSADAVNKHKNGTETITSVLYAGNKSIELKSTYSESMTTNAANNCWSFNGQFYPDGMASAAEFFSANKYLNTLEFDVTNGTVTIGIKNEVASDANWCILDNWKLEAPNLCDNSEEAMSKIVINEIQSCNLDQFVDPSFNYGAWMEVYNPNDKAIDLKGCYVSNDETNPTKDVLRSSLIIEPKGVGTIWFDHYWQYATSQINFKPSVEGGTLFLYSPQGALIASQEYPQMSPRTSMARNMDGTGEWGITSKPTPDKSNNGTVFATKRIAAPEISEKSGFFTGSKTFSVTIPEGTTLRYTTDGSTPSATNGTTSTTGEFSCDATTCFRFCLTAEDKLPSPVITRTFILKSREHSLPVISIVSDPKNFYSNELGIFTKGTNGCPGRGQSGPCNWNMEWDRPGNFEYFDINGENQVNQEVGLERCGGWSRAWLPYSFKVKANKTYEMQNFLPYDFFPAKPHLKHKTLQIRNGGNDNNCKIKDPALQQIVATSGLYIDYQEYIPVQHYINGKYAGVINMREPNNKHYAYSNYGVDDDLVDAFEMSPDSNYVQMNGNAEAFERWYKLSSSCGTNASSYEEICSLVDIDNYCNYMAVEFFLGGTDWPQNNIKGFREPIEGSKFHFVLFDLDGAFATTSPFTTFGNKRTYTFDYLYGIDGNGNPITGKRYTEEIKFITIFLNMLKNNDFRKKFIDTFCLVAGSVFEENRCKSIITKLENKVKAAMALETEVYGKGTSPSNTVYDLNNKLTNIRANTLVQALKDYPAMKLTDAEEKQIALSTNNIYSKILLNGLPVPTNKFSGRVFLPAKVKAVAPPGCYFYRWECEGKEVSTDIEYEITKDSPSEIYATYKALTKEMIEAKGHPTSPVVINEVSADNSIFMNDYDKKDDWVELYNTTSSPIDIKGCYITDNLSKPKKYCITESSVEGSTIIPAHGFKMVWCGKRDPLKELHASFKLDNNDDCVVRIQAADNSWSDEMHYSTMRGDESYGRFPDGTGNIYHFTHPTNMKSNMLIASDKNIVNVDEATEIVSVSDNNDKMKARCVGNTLIIDGADSEANVRILTVSGAIVLNERISTHHGHAELQLSQAPNTLRIINIVSGGKCCTIKK